MGILAALYESQRSNTGQVVDAAMVDGASTLMSLFYSFKQYNMWKTDRESNFLDGGAHFYCTYACSDGKHIAVGAVEPQFYKMFLDKLDIDDDDQRLHSRQMDASLWPMFKEQIAVVIQTKVHYTLMHYIHYIHSYTTNTIGSRC